jgi:acyl carrier protein
MADAKARLIRCFAGVFWDLPESEIPTASVTTVEAWDSVAAVTLLTVVEEGFGVQFDPEEIEHLSSFKSILKYIGDKKGVT